MLSNVMSEATAIFFCTLCLRIRIEKRHYSCTLMWVRSFNGKTFNECGSNPHNHVCKRSRSFGIWKQKSEWLFLSVADWNWPLGPWGFIAWPTARHHLFHCAWLTLTCPLLTRNIFVGKITGAFQVLKYMNRIPGRLYFPDNPFAYSPIWRKSYASPTAEKVASSSVISTDHGAVQTQELAVFEAA